MTALPQRVDVGKERTGTPFVFALGVYFTIQVVMRVAQLDGLELDEAESVFFAQKLMLGYGNQPPLYSWLQWLVFELFGVGHFGLSLLKNALMFMQFACVYGLATMLLSRLAAAAIAASLVLIVPLGWEAQLDRTHSILATALAAAALWTYFGMLRKPTAARFALFGALLGLGMQAKYNYLVFVIGLAVASLMVPEHRKLIWTRNMWIALGAATLCLLPHALWFVNQLDEATRETLDKMSDGNSYGSYLLNLGYGTKNLLVSLISFITPLWIVLAAVYRSPRQARAQLHTPEARLFLWMYAAGLACIAALVLTGELAHTRSRWLQTLLFSLPLACFICFPPRHDAAYRRLLLFSAVAGVVMTAALGVRPYVQTAFGRHPRINQPYPELSAEIAHRFPGIATVVVPGRHIGGNLRIQPPHFWMRLPEEMCGEAGSKMLVLLQPGVQGQRMPCVRRVILEGRLHVRSELLPEESLLFDYMLVEAGALPARR